MAHNGLQKTGVYHLGSKWVVQAHYPKISDYVEESFADGRYHEAVEAKDRHVAAGANVQIHEHTWEARALKLHQTRKASSAHHYPWAEPLTFEGGERDFCLRSAKNAIAEEERIAAHDAAVAAELAAMTDDQLEANIAMCDFEVAGRYPREVIEDFRAERRLYVAEQFRRSVAPKPATLDDVTALVCGRILSTAGVDAVMEAAE